MTIALPPSRAKDLGFRTIDVREFPEYAAGFIPGSEIVPLSAVAKQSLAWARNQPLLIVCRTGKRAANAAKQLEDLGFENLAVLEGGIDAWRTAGFPLLLHQGKPWSLERQIRVIAGSMILVFTALGVAVSSWFFILTLFVGAGLLFAGLTDFCLMATFLGRMPWNRLTAQNSRTAVCEEA